MGWIHNFKKQPQKRHREGWFSGATSEGGFQGRTWLGSWRHCKADLAFPQSRIKEASQAVIQGENSQWGRPVEHMGNMGPLNSDFHVTPSMTAMWQLVLLPLKQKGPEWNTPTPQSTDLPCWDDLHLWTAVAKHRPHCQAHVAWLTGTWNSRSEHCYY
jgi:hypothetical protein